MQEAVKKRPVGRPRTAHLAWAGVDWSKPTAIIAAERGCSLSVAVLYRKRFAPPEYRIVPRRRKARPVPAKRLRIKDVASTLDGLRSLTAIHPATGCWEWKGPTQSNGYPRISGKYAHRFVYEFHCGDIQPGQVVRHACDNPKCVNPAHLTLGTQLQNIGDRDARGRGQWGKRLTDDDVVRLRIGPTTTADVIRLAEERGVSFETVHKAWKGRSYKYVAIPPVAVAS